MAYVVFFAANGVDLGHNGCACVVLESKLFGRAAGSLGRTVNDSKVYHFSVVAPLTPFLLFSRLLEHEEQLLFSIKIVLSESIALMSQKFLFGR